MENKLAILAPNCIAPQRPHTGHTEGPFNHFTKGERKVKSGAIANTVMITNAIVLLLRFAVVAIMNRGSFSHSAGQRKAIRETFAVVITMKQTRMWKSTGK